MLFADIHSARTYRLHHPQIWPWDNVTIEELACRGSGEVFLHYPTIDALSELRRTLHPLVPVHINSAHRSALHNAHVGGAPRSAHRFLALDVKLPQRRDHARLMYHLCAKSGFTSFGFYNTFIHVDLRGSASVQGRRRVWYGSRSAREKWHGIFK